MSQTVTTPRRYYKFAKVALDLAAVSDNGMTHSLCALVIRRNRVLSVGYNSRKTSPMMRDSDMQMWHAECHAISRCSKDDLIGAELVVVRSKKSKDPGMAKPCAVCQKALERAGIKRVYYSTDDEEMQLEELRL